MSTGVSSAGVSRTGALKTGLLSARSLRDRRFVVAGAPVLLAVMVIASACGGADRRITVFAAASLADVFEEIADAFEAEHPEVEVRLSFGGSQRLRLQLTQGAEADVFASANLEQIALAEAEGLTTSPAATFAGNQLVVVIPASNPAGIGAVEDLTGDIRLVVAGSSVPAGRLTRDILDRLGLADAVLSQVVSEEESVRRVLTKVVLAEADAGFVYRTDAISAAAAVITLELNGLGVDLAGLRNDYLIATTSDTSSPELAVEFVAFVESETAQAILREAGFLNLVEGAEVEVGQ